MSRFHARSGSSRALQCGTIRYCSISVVALTLLLSVGGQSASPSQTSSAGDVLNTERLTLPSFADLAAGPRSPTEAESCCSAADMKVYERARTDSRFEMLRVTYTSDGLPVVAFIYKPSAAGDKRPVVVYNRGSYVRQNAARELLVTFHRLADAGFLIVAPMYRGSEGAPGRDEMGGAELADLMNIRPVIESLPYADTASLFLYGESRGGMMTLQALRDGFPTRAAAIVGVFTDLEQYLKEEPKAAALGPQLFPDYESNRAAIIERRSAVRWAERITAPLLIMHGGDDTSVNPAHALQLAGALQRSGKRYELVIAAGARHVLEPFEADRDERAIRWFRRYLTVERQ
jgi:dipeptidyl aminopeptidase/acylaminoacyl peptidase